MQDELKQIQKKVGTTFLYVTHDQGEALTMSDTIAVMNKGNIVQNGSPDEIYNYPGNRFTADFIGAGNFIKLASIELSKNIYDLTTETGRRFTLKKASNKQKSNGPNNSKNLPAPVFFIRPEKIMISVNSLENKNLFKGTIKSVTFEGPDIRLEVQSPDIGPIMIEVKNDGAFIDYTAR